MRRLVIIVLVILQVLGLAWMAGKFVNVAWINICKRTGKDKNHPDKEADASEHCGGLKRVRVRIIEQPGHGQKGCGMQQSDAEVEMTFQPHHAECVHKHKGQDGKEQQQV